MRAWGAAALIIFLLSGCSAGGSDGDDQMTSSSSSSSPSPTASSTSNTTAPLPNATVNQTLNVTPTAPGLAMGHRWTGCEYTLSVVFHNQANVEDKIPAGYNQFDAGGGIGNGDFIGVVCQGVSIGNATFLENVGFAFYAIQVRPPADRDATAAGNLFVLEAVTDSEEYRQLLLNASVPVLPGTVATDPAWVVTAEGNPWATLVHEDPNPGRAARNLYFRLHWAIDGGTCWMDGTNVAAESGQGYDVVRAEGGVIAEAAEPAGALAGPGARGMLDSDWMPPTCAAGG